MKPTSFVEKNRTYVGPPGSGIKDLPAHNDGLVTSTCWKLTWKERLCLLLHGHVWLRVYAGVTTPPVLLTCARTIFAPRATLPVIWRPLVKRPSEICARVLERHDIQVPKYPYFAEATSGPDDGRFLTAYDGCLYRFSSIEAGDAVAKSEKWVPDKLFNSWF